jgi:hypothetical protein
MEVNKMNIMINELSERTQNEIINELLHNGLNNHEINDIMNGTIENMNDLLCYDLYSTLLTA